MRWLAFVPALILAGLLLWVRWRLLPRRVGYVRLVAELHGLFSRETVEAVAELRLVRAFWRWLWMVVVLFAALAAMQAPR